MIYLSANCLDDAKAKPHYEELRIGPLAYVLVTWDNIRGAANHEDEPLFLMQRDEKSGFWYETVQIRYADRPNAGYMPPDLERGRFSDIALDTVAHDRLDAYSAPEERVIVTDTDRFREWQQACYDERAWLGEFDEPDPTDLVEGTTICGVDYMAGQICMLPPSHEGSHR